MSLAYLKKFSLEEMNDMEVREEQFWIVKPEINYSKYEFLKLFLQVVVTCSFSRKHCDQW